MYILISYYHQGHIIFTTMLKPNELRLDFYWDASECLFAPHEGSCKVVLGDDTADEDDSDDGY